MFPDAQSGRPRPVVMRFAADPETPDDGPPSPAAGDLTPEQKRGIAAVNAPESFDAIVHNNTLRVQHSGAPRAGSMRTFLNLLEKRAKKRFPKITLEEVTKITRRDTESSTYLFTHTEQDAAALEQFAAELKAEFKKLAMDLPVPMCGNEFQMVVRATPDRPHQLNAILNHFEKLAHNQEAGSINLVALDGRRDESDEVEGEYFSELRFVISLPGELVAPDDLAAQVLLADNLRQLGAERGEKWTVDIRPYTGQFIDLMAGNYPKPDATPVRRD
jgi:hypothetical protein